MLIFQPMTLYINTENKSLISVTLKNGDQVIDTLSDENKFGSQALLPLILRVLKKNKLEFSDLKGIEVSTGPGSFTGIKVGVSVANALGYSLGIPVNGKDMELDIKYE